MAKKKTTSEKSPSGIDTITSPVGPAPYAVPRLIRGADGLMHTIYVDAATNQPLSDLNGYSVLTQSAPVANDLDLPNIDPTKGSTDGGLSDEDEITPAGTPNFTNKGEGMRQDMSFGNPRYSTDINANFGYVSKPSVVTALGKMPGQIGLLGKAVNAGFNMNSLASANQARAALGLAPVSVRDDIGGIINGTGGQIANVSFNNVPDKTYNIGFEALSPDGKTNLTVAEAQKRANMFGGLTEAPKDDKKTEKKGVVAKALDKALDTVFGKATDTPKKDEQTYGAPTDPVTRAPLSAPAPASTYSDAGTITSAGSPIGDVTPGRDPNNVAVGFNMGRNRPEAPKDAITNAIKGAVAATVGDNYGVSITSGQQSAAQKAKIAAGQAAIAKAKAGLALSKQEQENAAFASKDVNQNHRHPTGLAADFGVVGLDGKQVTDRAKLADVMSNMAFSNPNVGLGFGKPGGYMGGTSIHADLTGLFGGNTWGGGIDNSQNPGRKSADGDDTNNTFGQALGMTIDAARAGNAPTPFSGAPTPTSRPDPASEPSGFVSQDERGSYDLGFGVDNSSTGAVTNTARALGATTEPSRLATGLAAMNSMAEMTPARMATLGMVARTPAEISAMARTIAGELSPSALKGLEAQDPNSMAELANIATTMENRAATKRFGNLMGALTPSQYNSLSQAAANVTNQNYSLYGAQIENALQGYYAGKVAPTDYGLTSYYNPDISNPAWGTAMMGATLVGDHIYGTLGEYGPSKSYKSMLGSMVSKNYAAPGFSLGTAGLDSPSETNAVSRSLMGSALEGATSANKGASLGQGGIGSDHAASSRASDSDTGTSRTSSALGQGGIGSDKGAESRAAGSSGGTGSGGIGGGAVSGASRSTAGKTSGTSTSSKGLGQGGIGHA